MPPERALGLGRAELDLAQGGQHVEGADGGVHTQAPALDGGVVAEAGDAGQFLLGHDAHHLGRAEVIRAIHAGVGHVARQRGGGSRGAWPARPLLPRLWVRPANVVRV